jgi:hypothetical protein
VGVADGAVPFALSQLAGTLLVQCGTSRVHAYENVISHVERPGAGLVLTGSRALAATDHTLNHLGYGGPVLADAGRYARTPRVPASAPFTDRWLDRQRALGLTWLVPDAGYIDTGQYRDLEAVLSRTRELAGGAIALLALHRSWLNSDGDLPWLVDHVTAAQVPIAVVLEHPKDPLGVRYVLEGLVALLAAPVDVLLLRCEVSAVGALCFGATAAAVGATATLRHLPGGGARGGSNGAGPSALLRPCLAYKRLSRIQLAVANDPDDPLWECRCGTCYGLPITALAGTGPITDLAFQIVRLLDAYDDTVPDQPPRTPTVRPASPGINRSSTPGKIRGRKGGEERMRLLIAYGASS